VIVFLAPGFLGEPLPFLGHFREERLEPRINRSAGFLQAPCGESSICSCALHLSPPLERNRCCGLKFHIGRTPSLVCHNFEAACSGDTEPYGRIRLPTFQPLGEPFQSGSISAFCTAFSSRQRCRPNSAPFVSRIGRTVGVGGGAVEKRSFVVKEQKFIRPVRCIKCGGNAHLIRRSPDPVKEDGSEVRIFECHECGHQTLRTVKA
jgi:hypothetical protein